VGFGGWGGVVGGVGWWVGWGGWGWWGGVQVVASLSSVLREPGVLFGAWHLSSSLGLPFEA
jgi:hypothetical protein